MKKTFSLAAVAVFMIILSATVAGAQTTRWTVDKAHTNVKFTVQHMTISEVEGSFRVFDGTMENAKPDFSDAKIKFTVDTRSVFTDNDYRDKHLRSDEFFNADKDSLMTFVSTAVKPLGNNKYELAGNLTIRSITKPIVFQVTHGGVLTTSKGAKAGFKAVGTVNRFDYNLKWDRATEAGGLVVGKDVELTLNVELNKVMN